MAGSPALSNWTGSGLHGVQSLSNWQGGRFRPVAVLFDNLVVIKWHLMCSMRLGTFYTHPVVIEALRRPKIGVRVLLEVRSAVKSIRYSDHSWAVRFFAAGLR